MTNYNTVQRQSEKAILAALVFHSCIDLRFAGTEGAELLQLGTRVIARGDVFLRSIDEDLGLDLDMNRDRL